MFIWGFGVLEGIILSDRNKCLYCTCDNKTLKKKKPKKKLMCTTFKKKNKKNKTWLLNVNVILPKCVLSLWLKRFKNPGCVYWFPGHPGCSSLSAWNERRSHITLFQRSEWGHLGPLWMSITEQQLSDLRRSLEISSPLTPWLMWPLMTWMFTGWVDRQLSGLGI